MFRAVRICFQMDGNIFNIGIAIEGEGGTENVRLPPRRPKEVDRVTVEI